MREIWIAPLLVAGIGAEAQAQAPTVAKPGAAAAEASQNGGIADIIVTAERREQSVQRSSLAIQVLSSAELENVRRAQDLTSLAPGLIIGSAGTNPQVYIRGVGDNANNSRAQNAVSFNVDGVTFARGSSVTTSFFDLARVEVLKGPQGTLYGRNSSGGAINLITNRPKIGIVEGYIGGTLGNFGLKEGEFALNVPFGSTVALRAAGQLIDRDGYLSDGAQDQRTEAGRARLLWKPSQEVSLLLNADVSHIGGNGSGVVLLPVQRGDPWRSNTDQPTAYPFQFNAATAPFKTPNDRAVEANIWGVSGELNVNFGPATLTVLPAFRHHKQDVISYNSNFRFAEQLDSKQQSLETRLGHDGPTLKWVIGGFYFRDRYFDQIDPIQNNLVSSVQFFNTVKSVGIFGQSTVSLTSALRAIGGLRYTKESTSGRFVGGRGGFPLIAFTPLYPLVNYSPVRAKKLNWKVGFEADVTPGSMLYATAATGFKAGGVSNTNTCGAINFEPENLTAYEAGMRNRFFGNSLQVNVEAFLWKYKGQQVSALAEVQCNGGPVTNTLLTYNVGRSTIKGGNIDLLWRATKQDTFHAFLEHAEGKYDSFSFTQVGAGPYAAGLGSLCTPTRVGGARYMIDCSGAPLARLPKWLAQFDYQHVFALGNDATLSPKVSAQVASKRWLDIGYGPNGHAKAYSLLNAELNFDSPGKVFSVGVFVRNITNEQVYTSGTSIAAIASNGYRYYTANIEPPRMYGVRGRFNF